MKNLLLASTALVASTAFAMADIDLSGNAEMGVFGVNDGDDIEDAELQFHTDINVTFTMAGETDAGLTFGAEVELSDIDQNDGAATGDDSDDGGVVIFVSGAYGTLTMGDTDGALDFALQEAIIGSAIRDNHEHAGYNGNSGLDGTYDGQVARYDYTFGDVSFALSAEVDDEQNSGGDEDLFQSLDEIEDNTVLGVGLRYSGDFAGFGFGAGLGYQQAGDSSVTGVSLDTEVAGFRVILNYSSYDDVPLAVGTLEDDPNTTAVDEALLTNNTALDDHFGIAVGYTFADILFSVNYGVYDTDQGDVDGYGMVANYDLGGGAALELGYGRSDFDEIGGEDDFDTYSFGISMDF